MAEAPGPMRRGRNFCCSAWQLSWLSQREGARLVGFLGHHKLCGVPGSASPHPGPSSGAAAADWGLSRAGGHVCRAGHSLILASAVHSCLAQLFRSLLPLLERCLRGSRGCFTFSLLPPLRHLSLSSNSCPACCRGRRPPSSFPSLLAVLSPGLNSALPRECLQHRQIFSNTHVPLRPEQI